MSSCWRGGSGAGAVEIDDMGPVRAGLGEGGERRRPDRPDSVSLVEMALRSRTQRPPIRSMAG